MLESRLDIQYNGVGTRAALSDKETAHGCEAVWLSTEEMIHVCKRAQGQGVREAAFEDTPFLRAQHFLWSLFEPFCIPDNLGVSRYN
jgi:hypothetical protein